MDTDLHNLKDASFLLSPICILTWSCTNVVYVYMFVKVIQIKICLTLLLLNTPCTVLANSVDPDQLASEEANWSGSALFVIKHVNFIKNPDQVIWLAGIRSGRGILIYSAWEGLNPIYIRIATWKNVPSEMCAQWRLRSACASAQSAQSLRCQHIETLHPWLSKMRPVKIQISLRESAGWSESSLGAHVRRDVFWHCGSLIEIEFFFHRFVQWDDTKDQVEIISPAVV